MTEPLPPLPEVWHDAVIWCEASADTHVAAAFGASLLQQLRERWESRIRMTASHWDLRFTRPEEHPLRGRPAMEEVIIRMVQDDRVEVSLRRRVPRRGESHPAGAVTVSGDFTLPQKALPAVEALLLQLAEPEDE